METETENAVKKTGNGFKFPFISFVPLGLKMALIVTLILLVSIWTITALMALMVGSEFIRTAADTNFDINSRAASGITERLYKVRSEALLLLDLTGAQGDTPATIQTRNIFFERNPNIAAVIIPGKQDIINQTFFTNNEISADTVHAWLAKETAAIDQAKAGDPALKNVSPVLGIDLLALFYPWQGTGYSEAAVVFFSPENLAEIAGTGSSSTLVINGDGDILVHPDFNQVLSGANIANNPLLEALRKSPGDSVRLDYTIGGNRFVGAGQQISFAGAAVLSSKDYSLITGQVVAVSRRNILLSVTVMFLTFLVTWLYSRTITTALRKLSGAAARMESGEFDPELKPKSRDELGALTEQFNRMGTCLRQRDETRILVGRCNNRELSARAIAGTIKLDGEFIKTVVLSVNFSSFYDNSKNLEAGESLELLNFFISKMADIVERQGGTVDKISGGRMIALWGEPFSSADISSADISSDGVSATGVCAGLMRSLNSVLAMRAALWDLNTERESQGKTPLRMNCGIAAGEILAGSMGTSAFREYSVAGKTLDDAIKCGEVAGTANIDIVITETALNLAGSSILSAKLDVRVREETDPAYFGLVNIAAGDGGKQRWPFTLDDVRESLGGKPAPVKEQTE